MMPDTPWGEETEMTDLPHDDKEEERVPQIQGAFDRESLSSVLQGPSWTNTELDDVGFEDEYRYSPRPKQMYRRYFCDPKCCDRSPKLILAVLGLLGTLGIVLLFTPLRKSSNKPTESSSPSPPISFACPTSVKPPLNERDDNFDFYVENDAQIANNLTHFRDFLYDVYPENYRYIKSELKDWKKQYFCGNLNSGDSIYESASGVGLNLFMTLEIVEDVCGLNSISIYGNDYVQESIDLAEKMYSSVLFGRAKSYHFCRADSADLSHIPSGTFDLVYTGYLEPIVDPLDLSEGWIIDRHYDIVDMCNSSDWAYQKLIYLDQEKQEDWYAQWVGEMIRIAKPGKAILLENLSYAICDEMSLVGGDWGGVNHDWWLKAVEKYELDVDPSSIIIEDTDLFFDYYNRYNVFMRKNS